MVKLQLILGAALYTTPLVTIPHEGSHFLRNTTASPFGQILLTRANFAQTVEA